MTQFDLTDDQLQIQEMARKFTADAITPNAAEWDEKHIFPNVDLYSGAAYWAMGIPTDQFTPIFAMSRIAGWTAHVLEQHGNNRLIRPRSDYTGQLDLKYVPLSER